METIEEAFNIWTMSLTSPLNLLLYKNNPVSEPGNIGSVPLIRLVARSLRQIKDKQYIKNQIDSTLGERSYLSHWS